MKKFSTSNGIKVNDAPNVDIKQPNHDIRNTIMELIDNSLRITSYGSARKEIQATVKIVGKEMLVEALINMIKDKETTNAIKALEMLKENVSDWVSIDANIDYIKEKQECYSFLNNNFDHVKGVLKLMERMTDDNTEPLLETIYDKYNNDALVFNEMLIENMIKSNDYNTNKLISLKSTIISKKK
jgi:predicted house-cleaning noncanonical NTP pyrophosphatase (MazG superfamily)